MTIQQIGTRQVVMLDQLTAPSQEDIVLFIRFFRSTLSSYSFYPPGHKMIMNRSEELYNHIKKLLKKVNIIAVAAEGGTISINGTAILKNVPEKEHAASLSSTFQLIGIKTTVILPEVTPEAMAEFVQSVHNLQKAGEQNSSYWSTFSGQGLVFNLPFVKQKDLENLELSSQSQPGGRPVLRSSLSPSDVNELLQSGHSIQMINTPVGTGPYEGTPLMGEAGASPQLSNTPSLIPSAQKVVQYGGKVEVAQQVIHHSGSSLPNESGFPVQDRGLSSPPPPSVRRSSTTSEGTKARSTTPDARGEQFRQIDPKILDQKPIDFSKLDFSKIDPAALFQSKRFREFLKRGGVEQFLNSFLGRNISNPSAAPPLIVVQDGRGSPAIKGGKSLLEALEKLDDRELTKKILSSMARDIANSIPELIEEQLSNLGDSSVERQLKRELIRQIPTSWSPLIVEMLQQRVASAKKPAELQKYVENLSFLLESLNPKDHLSSLVSGLELMRKIQKKLSSNPKIQQQLDQHIEQISSPKLQNSLLEILEKSPDKQLKKESEKALSLLGKSAFNHLVTLFEKARGEKERQRYLKLMAKTIQNLPKFQQKEILESFYKSSELFRKSRKIKVFELFHKLIPESLERLILAEEKSLPPEPPANEDSRWVQWVELALRCHTPKIRERLLKHLQTRRFIDFPQIEEKILKLLDLHGTIDTIRWLSQEIADSKKPLEHRSTAVWLLGSLANQESLMLLRKILLERTRFFKNPVYPPELRFQALDALRHFPWRQVIELIRKVSSDPNQQIREYAQQMLKLGSVSTQSDN